MTIGEKSYNIDLIQTLNLSYNISSISNEKSMHLWVSSRMYPPSFYCPHWHANPVLKLTAQPMASCQSVMSSALIDRGCSGGSVETRWASQMPMLGLAHQPICRTRVGPAQVENVNLLLMNPILIPDYTTHVLLLLLHQFQQT